MMDNQIEKEMVGIEGSTGEVYVVKLEFKV